MSTATTEIQVKDKEAIKQKLLNEVRLAIELNDSGIRYNPDDLKSLRKTETIPYPFQGRIPGVTFTLPHGIKASGKFYKWTPFSINVENGKPILYNESTPVAEILFYEQPVHSILEEQLSTGEKVKSILSIDPHGQIDVSYSAECALKDKGEDCLFCSINVRERDPERLLLKNPRQIAEAYSIVRKAGYGRHFKISGGFVPERRELEYYIDVVEAIREKHSKFNGVAVIGAPADLSVLPKYKEAGYTDLSHNLEVWDKNLFAHICPGKSRRNGGWEHWVESLQAAVEVFGKGHVHSNFVGGLDTKEEFLDGIEFLSSKGVVAHFGMFSPQINTGLQGKRTPEPWYHWEVADRATDIQIRHGFTTEQMYRGPGTGDHTGRIFRIKKGDFEGDTMDIYQFPPID
jgi:hypothetical protein